MAAVRSPHRCLRVAPSPLVSPLVSPPITATPSLPPFAATHLSTRLSTHHCQGGASDSPDLKLGGKYNYLSDISDLNKNDPAKGFQEVRKAMMDIGFDQAELIWVWTLLAVILKLGCGPRTHLSLDTRHSTLDTRHSTVHPASCAWHNTAYDVT